MSAGERMRRPLSSATLSAISACGVGRRPGGQRQDRVVDVDHPVAAAVDQRRQLVHPAAVIDVVIAFGLLHPLPAGVEQRRLDRVEAGARHHDVEVADAAADAGVEIGGVEGGALHQDHRHAERRERAARHLGLPQRLGARLGGVAARGLEDRRDPGGNGPALHPEGEAADQLLGAGGADQARSSRSRRPKRDRAARGRGAARRSCRQLPPEILDQADRACRCRDSRSPAPDTVAISRFSASKPRRPSAT